MRIRRDIEAEQVANQQFQDKLVQGADRRIS
jgi:hypothetical protein